MMDSIDFNIFSMILDSGIVVKGVFLCLIICSIVSWGIIFQKIFLFQELSLSNEKFFKIYSSTESIEALAKVTYSLSYSPYKTLLFYGFKEFNKLKGEDYSTSYLLKYGPQHFKRGLKQGVNNVNKRLEKSLSILASIGSIGPFVGLLGTVWGILNSFRGIASSASSLESVAPGIAEALLATAFGLFAAIPSVWFYNSFLNKIAHFHVQMEDFHEDILNALERSLFEKV